MKWCLRIRNHSEAFLVSNKFSTPTNASTSTAPKRVTMARGKELSPAQRTFVCDLKQSGNTYKKIHKLLPQIPLSAIKTTCLRAAKRGSNNTSLPRAGAPRKLTEKQRDRIHDVVTNNNPSIKMKDLIEEFGHTTEKRSMQNLLREMDLKPRVAK